MKSKQHIFQPPKFNFLQNALVLMIESRAWSSIYIQSSLDSCSLVEIQLKLVPHCDCTEKISISIESKLSYGI
jgi:hypothetical protein